MAFIQFGSSSPAAAEAKSLRKQIQEQNNLLMQLQQHAKDKTTLGELRSVADANQVEIDKLKRELGLA